MIIIVDDDNNKIIVIIHLQISPILKGTTLYCWWQYGIDCINVISNDKALETKQQTYFPIQQIRFIYSMKNLITIVIQWTNISYIIII